MAVAVNQQDPILKGMNAQQQLATAHGDGPLLIFAGAGSGKTRVLTHRIAYLMREKNLAPKDILAVTFTNKAAKEMKERIGRLVGTEKSDGMWVGTFHAICGKLLRKHGCPSGATEKFSIYDTDDSVALMKKVLIDLNINTEQLTPTVVLTAISAAKNELQTPEVYYEYTETAQQRTIAQCYEKYQEELVKNNALDFDDMLMEAVALLRGNYDILSAYQLRFRYMFVDEFQDLNQAQAELIKLLSGRWRNLCVVGDDDQSLYSWRGAKIDLILSFDKLYPGTTIIKLEQNYRSTKCILSAAAAVIQNNTKRAEKTLWTEQHGGDLVEHRRVATDQNETQFIVKQIMRAVRDGRQYKDCAVLYRVNALSRSVEQALVRARIPYHIVGGTRFFGRKEVKDVIAYLKAINNPLDRIALQRIINVPARGISDKAVSTLEAFAEEYELTFWEALHKARPSGITPKAVECVGKFVTMMEGFQASSGTIPIEELITQIIAQSGYETSLGKEKSEEAEQRLGNIEELKSVAIQMAQDEDGEISLTDFLEKIGLAMDVESDDVTNSVTLMSLHGSKGLEYSQVFIVGMEEGIFPSGRALQESLDAMEEERRLCYVGMTRAKHNLYLLSTKQRMLYGKTNQMTASRFLEEIPEEFINYVVEQGYNGGSSYNGGYGDRSGGRW